MNTSTSVVLLSFLSIACKQETIDRTATTPALLISNTQQWRRLIPKESETHLIFNTQQTETQLIFDTQQHSCKRKCWLDLPDTLGIGGVIYSMPESSDVFPSANTQSKAPAQHLPFASHSGSSIVHYGILNKSKTRYGVLLEEC